MHQNLSYITHSINYYNDHSANRTIISLKPNIDIDVLTDLKTRTIEIYAELRRLHDIIILLLVHNKATRVTKVIANVASVLLYLADNASPFTYYVEELANLI